MVSYSVKDTDFMLIYSLCSEYCTFPKDWLIAEIKSIGTVKEGCLADCLIAQKDYFEFEVIVVVLHLDE